MNIRLLAIGSQGDVQPFGALGLGLQRAGFDVSVATTINFKTFVESRGLACITSDMDIQAAVRREKQGEPSGQTGRRRKAKWEVFQMLLDETLRLSQDAGLLIYSPAASLTAPHVAEKLGIPAISAPLQPYMDPTRDFPAVAMPALNLGGWYNLFSYTMFEQFVWLALRGRINRWRRDVLGLPPYKEGPFTTLRRQHATTLYAFSPTVLPKPAEWGENVHVTGYWFLPHAEDWQPPAELVDFLAAGPAPVYVGFGSMASRNPQETARIVLNAIRQTGVRAVIASGWGGLSASDVPPSVHLIKNAPHDWLFPRMAAVVHHGGAGTTAAGLRAGVPSVIVPFGGDQPFWGRRVHAIGAGLAPIPHKRLTAERLAEALRVAVSDETMCRRAAELGAKIRAEDGVDCAVRIIEQVAQKA
jgi:sterol 3beta-glucosyltransferase